MKDSNTKESTPSKWSGRKVVFTFIALAILVGAFVMMKLMGPISDMQFAIWVAGILTALGIHNGSNVMQKKFLPGAAAPGRQDEGVV